MNYLSKPTYMFNKTSEANMIKKKAAPLKQKQASKN